MTLLAYNITSIFTSAAQTAIQWYRDDDKEEKTLDDYLLQFISNYLQDSFFVGKIPYFKDVISLMQGYSASTPYLEWLECAVKAVKYWQKAIEGKDGAMEKAIKNTAQSISYVSGIPAYNLYRDIEPLLELIGLLEDDD